MEIFIVMRKPNKTGQAYCISWRTRAQKQRAFADYEQQNNIRQSKTAQEFKKPYNKQFYSDPTMLRGYAMFWKPYNFLEAMK